MGVVICMNCGGKVSDERGKCPRCGHPVMKSAEQPRSATLTECAACGKAISPEAASCPNCGHPVPRALKSQAWAAADGCEKTARFFSIGCLAPVLLLMGYCYLNRGDSPSPLREMETRETAGDAAFNCQELVKRQLKAPSTAEFPNAFSDEGHKDARKRDDGSWYVVSYVDAENTFGAKLRTLWACTITRDGTTWRGEASLVELK